MAQPAVGRIAVDHRIHVAAGDAEEQARLAQRLEWFGRVPVGLRDDADPEPLGFEQPADDRHAETRMVDIGVARHEHDVAGVPAECAHLGAAHRQERCRPAGMARRGNERPFGVDGAVHDALA